MKKKKGQGKLFIKGAIKKPGALTASAKGSGKSPMAFAAANKNAKGKLGQRARFALLLQSFRKKKKVKK